MQREGDDILEAARVRAERMVQRTEIVREAQHTARRTVEEARDEARRLRHEAEDYCDQKLAVVRDRARAHHQDGARRPGEAVGHPAAAARGAGHRHRRDRDRRRHPRRARTPSSTRTGCRTARLGSLIGLVTARPFLVNVAAIRRSPGARRPERRAGPDRRPRRDRQRGRCPAPRSTSTPCSRWSAAGSSSSGRSRRRGVGECRRCLGEVRGDLTVDVREIYEPGRGRRRRPIDRGGGGDLPARRRPARPQAAGQGRRPARPAPGPAVPGGLRRAVPDLRRRPQRRRRAAARAAPATPAGRPSMRCAGAIRRRVSGLPGRGPVGAGRAFRSRERARPSWPSPRRRPPRPRAAAAGPAPGSCRRRPAASARSAARPSCPTSSARTAAGTAAARPSTSADPVAGRAGRRRRSGPRDQPDRRDTGASLPVAVDAMGGDRAPAEIVAGRPAGGRGARHPGPAGRRPRPHRRHRRPAGLPGHRGHRHARRPGPGRPAQEGLVAGPGRRGGPGRQGLGHGLRRQHRGRHGQRPVPHGPAARGGPAGHRHADPGARHHADGAARRRRQRRVHAPPGWSSSPRWARPSPGSATGSPTPGSACCRSARRRPRATPLVKETHALLAAGRRRARRALHRQRRGPRRHDRRRRRGRHRRLHRQRHPEDPRGQPAVHGRRRARRP